MKKKNILLTGVVIIIIISVIPFIKNYLISFNCIYLPTHNNNERYFYLFKDKLPENYHLIYSAGRTKQGWIYAYLYKNNIRILIWEIMNTNITSENISIKAENNSDSVFKQNTFLYSDIGPEPLIRISNKPCPHFNKEIRIDLDGIKDSYSRLENRSGYEFKGKIKDITFRNEKDEVVINIHPLHGENPIPVYLSAFIQNNRLFIILMDSLGNNLPFSESREILK